MKLFYDKVDFSGVFDNIGEFKFEPIDFKPFESDKNESIKNGNNS